MSSFYFCMKPKYILNHIDQNMILPPLWNCRHRALPEYSFTEHLKCQGHFLVNSVIFIFMHTVSIIPGKYQLLASRVNFVLNIYFSNALPKIAVEKNCVFLKFWEIFWSRKTHEIFSGLSFSSAECEVLSYALKLSSNNSGLTNGRLCLWWFNYVSWNMMVI